MHTRPTRIGLTHYTPLYRIHTHTHTHTHTLGAMSASTEPLALEALKNWQHITGIQLVPEHVESRVLHNMERPGIEQVSVLASDSGGEEAGEDLSEDRGDDICGDIVKNWVGREMDIYVGREVT